VNKNLLLGTALLVALVAPIPSHAQTGYPAGPIRIIVPFPAGGPASVVSRVISERLQSAFSQPVINDNRTGAGGNLGTDIVAKSAPDGLTLLLGTNGPLVINPNMMKSLPFDPVKDFAPISLIATIPLVLIVHPSVQANTLSELLALARDRPGQLNYASSGNGSGGHLAGALLESMAGVKMTHVPYRGAAPAMNDLLGGHVQMMFVGLLSALPYIDAGQVKAIAVATPKRATLAPHIPTVAESGVPGFEITSWYGLLAPVGTPEPIIARLHREIVAALQQPDAIDRLFVKGGLERVGGGPEEFAATLRREIPEYARIVELAGAKMN
jgi:tripartite-type tricarboxylate transporter receptor subunit TctC